MTAVFSAMPAWTPAYIALGSNLDQPKDQIHRALRRLATLPGSCAMLQSALYCSAPMGPQDQPSFVNAAAGLLTCLTAVELFNELQAIEQSMGRQSAVTRWGPRIIDLDLLLFGVLRADTTQLQLPHPGLLVRNFVITPLADIAPQLQLPNGMTTAQLAAQLGHHGLQKLAAP